MDIQGGKSAIKASIPEKTDTINPKAVSSETDFGNINLVEALINADTKKVFSLQQSSNGKYVISKITDFIYESEEFVEGDSQSLWEYVETDNVCEAVRKYCVDFLSITPEDVVHQVDTTAINSCMNKIH